MSRWTWTVATLLGEPLPPLPNLPGRRIVCSDKPTPATEIEANTEPTKPAPSCERKAPNA